MFFTSDNLTNKNVEFSLNTFLALYDLCDNKKNTLLQSYSATLKSFNENNDNNYFVNLHTLLSQFREVLDDINFCVEKSNSIVNQCKELQKNVDTEKKETYVHSLNVELEQNYNKVLDKLSLVDIFISDTVLKSSSEIPILLNSTKKPTVIKQAKKLDDLKLIDTKPEEKNIIENKETIKITNTQIGPKSLDIIKEEEKTQQPEEKDTAPVISVFQEFNDNDTLLISDTNKKVFLPYRLTDLKEILEKDPSYSTLEEVIEDNFVLPINRFHNSAVSRFKEGYSLMKEKENKNRLSAIELGLELAFNNSLNPAIITACENLEQLDTYLDYLDENQTENFPYFKIKYDIKPLK